MKIEQFRYSRDNLGYLVYGDRQAGAIDGGAVDDILEFINANGLTLCWATNTHTHPDHTAGTAELVDRTGAEFISVQKAMVSDRLSLDGESIRVIQTPGHTNDSICFHFDDILVTGDTLFNGTVGNCFSGDLTAFYQSIRTLMAFPPETRIFSGHDYVKESLDVARRLEPGNREAVDRYLENYDAGFIVSTLADELAVNPYLRYNEPSMVAVMKAKGFPVETERDRWNAMMSME